MSLHVFFCVKPSAPEAQRLDDAIGFLRDHAEVNVSNFSFVNDFDVAIKYSCFLVVLVCKNK